MILNAAAAPLSPFAGLDIGEWLRRQARWRSNHTLLVWAPFEGDERRWSYAEFARDVAAIAGGLSARGIKAEDRILVHLENCPETLLVRFACAWLGAICVGVNPGAAGPELSHFAGSTGAVAAITQSRLAELVAQHCPDLRWLVTVEDAAPASRSRATGDRFASLMREPARARIPDPDAIASIMFTSGTTSLPKGVAWTHANVLWGARVNALQQRLRPDDVALLYLPLFHVVGLSWCFHAMLWAGGATVLQPRFSASAFWPAALHHRATIGSQVLATQKILKQQPVPDHGFRTWICANHAPEQEAHFKVGLVAGWGMTELLTQAVVCEPGSNPPANVIGRPSVGYSVRIVDEGGRAVLPGGSGELLVGGIRGLSIFKEYDRNPAASAAAFDDAGYFRSGDRVMLREDGWIAFGDRIKDVLKVGGEGVSAAEIEAVIASLAMIRDVAVVGRPDDIYGELPVAFVVVHPSSPVSGAVLVETVLSRCRDALSAFKVPHHVEVLKISRAT